jgi:hypothetical protein
VNRDLRNALDINALSGEANRHSRSHLTTLLNGKGAELYCTKDAVFLHFTNDHAQLALKALIQAKKTFSLQGYVCPTKPEQPTPLPPTESFSLKATAVHEVLNWCSSSPASDPSESAPLATTPVSSTEAESQVTYPAVETVIKEFTLDTDQATALFLAAGCLMRGLIR